MNRQVYPSSLFPLRGDVSAEANAISVRVIGVQGIPIVAPALLINGIGQSFDKQIFINGTTDGATSWSISINGTDDGG
jgi:hypothetical protein